MRIRKRPQIPVPPSDLPAPSVPAQVGAATTTTTAPPTSASAAAPAGGGHGGSTGEGLHPTGGDPLVIKPPRRCTSYQSPSAGRDLARSTGYVVVVDGPNSCSSHSSSAEVLPLLEDEQHKIWSGTILSAAGVLAGEEANCSTNINSSRAPPPDHNAAAGRSTSTAGLVPVARGGKEEDYMKAKKTCSSTTTDNDDNGSSSVVMNNGRDHVVGKKRRSPAVLMEGSRCSRVNGRGWRCCQQTLVGYSLCEHHLGKGRLRSVNNNTTDQSKAKRKLVTNNGLRRKAAAVEKSSTLPVETNCNNGEEEIKQVPAVVARRKKIGMVKARSISSLLDETCTTQAHAGIIVVDGDTAADHFVASSNGARRRDLKEELINEASPSPSS